MSTVTTHPTQRARRAQIVAEAVVSAYIREIAPTERPRARRGCAETPRTVTRHRAATLTPRRSFALRRREAVQLGA